MRTVEHKKSIVIACNCIRSCTLPSFTYRPIYNRHHHDSSTGEASTSEQAADSPTHKRFTNRLTHQGGGQIPKVPTLQGHSITSDSHQSRVRYVYRQTRCGQYFHQSAQTVEHKRKTNLYISMSSRRARPKWPC